jgi:hypothetical protein
LTCEGSTGLIYQVTDVVGVSYNWSVPGDWSIVSGQGTSSIIVNAGSAAGSIIVTPSNPCGNGISQSLSVNVQFMVTATVSIDQAPIGGVCEGTGITFTANPVNGGLTPVYEWFHNGISVGSGATYTPAIIADGDEVYVTMASSEVCVTPALEISSTVIITVYPLPAAPIITLSGDSLISSYVTGNQWFNSAGSIGGETNQWFVPLVNDTYQVMYTDGNGCSVVSDTIQILYTGVDEQEISFSIFPNPVVDVLHIDFGQSIQDELVIQLHNVIGELLQTQTFVNINTADVKMASYPDGVYFISLHYQGKSVIQKIVVNRH